MCWGRMWGGVSAGGGHCGAKGLLAKRLRSLPRLRGSALAVLAWTLPAPPSTESSGDDGLPAGARGCGKCQGRGQGLESRERREVTLENVAV